MIIRGTLKFLRESWVRFVLWGLVLWSVFQTIIASPSSEGESLLAMATTTVLASAVTGLTSISRNRERRGVDIYESLIGEPAKAQRAKELYLSAESYRFQALLNGFAAIVVLLVVALFVGFAGQILARDTVVFNSLESTQMRLASLENYISGVSGTLDERILKVGETYQKLSDEYFRISALQTQAEADMNHPEYRIATTLLVRVSVVLVGIYLVVLMNRAFQYNNALAAMYRARLMAVMRGDNDTADFLTYATAYDPGIMKYDPDIEHPMERMAKLLEAMGKFATRQTPESAARAKGKPTGRKPTRGDSTPDEPAQPKE